MSWLISQLTLNISGSSQQWFYRLFISATCKGHVHLELLYACSSSHIVSILVQCITAGYLGADAIEVFISEQMLLKCSNRLLISAACKGCVRLRLLYACSSSHIVSILVQCITSGYLRADAVEVACQINGKFACFWQYHQWLAELSNKVWWCIATISLQKLRAMVLTSAV